MDKKYDKRHLKFGNSSAVLDPCTISCLKDFNFLLEFDLYNQNITDKFCIAYVDWIRSSKINIITGLENFKYHCYSNGTTEAFDKFYLKNSKKRFRCFQGEYMYHRLAWRNYFPDWKFIEDEDLLSGDAVVISLPFSDTGNIHLSHNTILKKCNDLKIPVLIDCAYFGICQNILFDLNYDCITDIVFSLSKTFPLSHARIGLRLTKEDNDDSLFVVNKSSYTNRLGACLGLEFISKFSPDYIPLTYRTKQIDMCNYLNVDVSNTVLFGIGNNMWNEYNRGTETNRLSFHKFLHLPIEEFYRNVKNN
jgi:hypothetical protein